MLTLLSARKLLSATITSQVLIYTCRFTHTVNRFKNKLFRPHGLNVYIKPVYIHRGGKSIYQVQVFGHLLQLPPKTRHINLPLTSAKQHKPVCLWVCSRVVRQPSKMLASNKQACNQIVSAPLAEMMIIEESPIQVVPDGECGIFAMPAACLPRTISNCYSTFP